MLCFGERICGDGLLAHPALRIHPDGDHRPRTSLEELKNDREAIIEIEILGARREQAAVQAVLDTGYDGEVSLPSEFIRQLSLSPAGFRRGMLADGSTVVLPMFLGTVMWHGRQRDVLVARIDETPLVGMGLLHGSRLLIDVIPDGTVTIETLP